MSNVSCVYCITCSITGRVYVGKTVNYHARVSTHKSSLRRGCHDNEYLQNHYNKYGDCLSFKILEEGSKSELTDLECKWIESLNSMDRKYGFNLRSAHDNSPMCEESKIKTKETRLLIYTFANSNRKSENLNKEFVSRGKGVPKSESHRRNISESNKGKHSSNSEHFRGRTHTEETKRKISALNTGRLAGDKNQNYGNRYSEEFKKELSARVSKSLKDPAIRKKMSESNKGRKASEEARAKRSKSQTGKTH